MQEYFGMLGHFDPLGIIDGLNAVGYSLRGQGANAIASGIAIVPFGVLQSLSKYKNIILYDELYLEMQEKLYRTQ